MANIIGIGGSLHDFSACLIEENSRIIAIEDERISKMRYSIGEEEPHVKSFLYCLKNAGLSSEDIDAIIGDDMISDSFFKDRIKPNHHLSHIYSTFFTSKFSESAILILDGVGSLYGSVKEEVRETTTYAYGKNNHIEIIGKVFGFPSTIRCLPSTPRVRCNSLGEFYRAITEIIGFGFLQAGKTMGLHPYGDSRFIDDMLTFVKFGSNGQFEIIIEGEKGLIKYIQNILNGSYSEDIFLVKASIANAAQIILETVLAHCLDYLWRKCKTDNLCLAGGVVLNSVANGKIHSISNFKNIHITSSPGDNGVAIGSAIYGKLLNQSASILPIRFVISPYLGALYTTAEILKALNYAGLNYFTQTNPERFIASNLYKGLIVACFQGKSEFGPRALGNRSIFADPRKKSMKDRINVIKGREWFRPVAPVITEDSYMDYFDAPCLSQCMQFVFPIKENYLNHLEGCVHIDGSARVQSVGKNDNPFLYGLLIEFQQLSGFPILINTSFNIAGKPIVETPLDAIQAFINSEIDILVIDEFIVQK